jgi:site-specific recombinase XerD
MIFITVKEVMDHADIRTTMRYVHATDEGKRKAVEAAAKGERACLTFASQD